MVWLIVLVLLVWYVTVVVWCFCLWLGFVILVVLVVCYLVYSGVGAAGLRFGLWCLDICWLCCWGCYFWFAWWLVGICCFLFWVGVFGIGLGCCGCWQIVFVFQVVAFYVVG